MDHEVKGEVVFSGRYLTLTTERKGDVTFERCYQRNGVSVIVVPESGTVRLISETDWRDDKRKTKVVSAYREDGEDALDCAKRELVEEMGFVAENWELYHVSQSDGAIIKSQHIFLASGLTEVEARPDAEEEIHGWADFTHEEVRDMALSLTFGTHENAFALLKFVSER